MNYRQKIFIITTITIMLLPTTFTILFSAENEVENNKLKVVTTFYPLSFFAREIGGEKVNVKQLIPDNIELHNWQPSPSDILSLSNADVIIYNGASLDDWLETDMLSIIDSTDKLIVETTEKLTLLKNDKDSNETNNEDNHVYDPHTWISPYMAKQQAQNIYEAFVQKDSANSNYYNERWENLKIRFEELDTKYLTTLATKIKTDIFVAHSAYGYLAFRYGFEQHGVIGISADEQPSILAYANLVELMMQYKIYVVYINPIYFDDLTQTLKNELERLSGQDVQILKLYFMLGEIDDLDFFGQQEKNLQNLKIGLEA